MLGLAKRSDQRSRQNIAEEHPGRLAWMAGLGVGAATLYALESERGKQRRHVLSHHASRAAHEVETAVAEKLGSLTHSFGGAKEISLDRSIHVSAPVVDVYRFWSNCANFARFMDHVCEVRSAGDHRWHWTVKGPAGLPVSFDTAVARVEASEIVWSTTAEAAVEHSGRLALQPQGEGTRLDISLCFKPVLGRVAHTLAAGFPLDSEADIDNDLMRMKALLESRPAPVERPPPFLLRTS